MKSTKSITKSSSNLFIFSQQVGQTPGSEDDILVGGGRASMVLTLKEEEGQHITDIAGAPWFARGRKSPVDFIRSMKRNEIEKQHTHQWHTWKPQCPLETHLPLLLWEKCTIQGFWETLKEATLSSACNEPNHQWGNHYHRDYWDRTVVIPQ